MKFEKLLNKMAKEVKMDKFKIIYMMMGDQNMKKLEQLITTTNAKQPTKVDKGNSPHNHYRPVSVGSQRYSTAQQVYNNIDK